MYRRYVTSFVMLAMEVECVEVKCGAQERPMRSIERAWITGLCKLMAGGEVEGLVLTVWHDAPPRSVLVDELQVYVFGKQRGYVICSSNACFCGFERKGVEVVERGTLFDATERGTRDGYLRAEVLISKNGALRVVN
jgi:hypothetical protein